MHRSLLWLVSYLARYTSCLRLMVCFALRELTTEMSCFKAIGFRENADATTWKEQIIINHHGRSSCSNIVLNHHDASS
jgi:hypothetical protein